MQDSNANDVLKVRSLEFLGSALGDISSGCLDDERQKPDNENDIKEEHLSLLRPTYEKIFLDGKKAAELTNEEIYVIAVCSGCETTLIPKNHFMAQEFQFHLANKIHVADNPDGGYIVYEVKGDSKVIMRKLRLNQTA